MGYIVLFLPQTVKRMTLPPSRPTISRTRSLMRSTDSSGRSALSRKMVSYSRSRPAVCFSDIFFSPPGDCPSAEPGAGKRADNLEVVRPGAGNGAPATFALKLGAGLVWAQPRSSQENLKGLSGSSSLLEYSVVLSLD